MFLFLHLPILAAMLMCAECASTNCTLKKTPGKTKKENDRRYVDFNRCGVPLVEMVTEPDLRSAEEAGQYLIRLRQLLRWLGISEADMEKGNLRCDANVFHSRKR